MMSKSSNESSGYEQILRTRPLTPDEELTYAQIRLNKAKLKKLAELQKGFRHLSVKHRHEAVTDFLAVTSAFNKAAFNYYRSINPRLRRIFRSSDVDLVGNFVSDGVISLVDVVPCLLFMSGREPVETLFIFDQAENMLNFS